MTASLATRKAKHIAQMDVQTSSHDWEMIASLIEDRSLRKRTCQMHWRMIAIQEIGELEVGAMLPKLLQPNQKLSKTESIGMTAIGGIRGRGIRLGAIGTCTRCLCVSA